MLSILFVGILKGEGTLNSRLVSFLLLAVAIAAIASGCGGDGDDTGVTTSSLGKAALLKKANSICSQGSETLIASLRTAGSEAPGKSASEAVKTIVPPLLREQEEKIRELGAPEGEEEKIEAYLTSLASVADTVEAKGADDVFKLQALLVKVNPSAEAAKLEACRY